VKLKFTEDAVGGAVARFAHSVKRTDGKYRGAAAANNPGESSGRNFSCEAPDLKKKKREGRRRVREQAARGHRQEPGLSRYIRDS